MIALGILATIAATLFLYLIWLTGKLRRQKRGYDDKTNVHWACRFHPTYWWHEVGCPHRDWSKEQLQSALSKAKKMNELYLTELYELGWKGLK